MSVINSTSPRAVDEDLADGSVRSRSTTPISHASDGLIKVTATKR